MLRFFSLLTRPADRSRWVYLLLVGLTVAAGLFSRSAGMPDFVIAYAGDALWALMVYLLIVLVKPRLPVGVAALCALAFSFGIELSQLWQTEWLNELRHTRLGGLVLGFGFLWTDLLCYMAGVGMGVGGELLNNFYKKY